ncbi:secreted RxLR effector protein 161-like [Belonocnema kinseyi]|uniref:secreted RxLR effector protein 161-like n=1 Tax=Belonocnema kinseyi TaxID=2817044 RepID=UPI00143CFC4E|nr:secreted RxLR effector protein 161-like [Belonocnema kinseyi]
MQIYPYPELIGSSSYLVTCTRPDLAYSVSYLSQFNSRYVDTDWGACPIDRRSYTGRVYTLSGGAVSWEYRKQKAVALSSTETEYRKYYNSDI